ncbi:MAG: hypothetical protein ABR540_17950 [Acidimicrobiales bacterium]
MNIWSVFVTGLFAGGASCAAVQGGLLAGAVARRQRTETPDSTDLGADGEPAAVAVPDPHYEAAATADVEPAGQGSRGGVGVLARPVAPSLIDDAAPVAGFMVGKPVSHVAFGALLGLFGAALQSNFRVRAVRRREK